MKLSTLYILMLITISASADIVGNKPRPSCTIRFAKLEAIKNYTFYYAGNNIDEITDESTSTVINNKTVITLRGGYGTPDYILFYAKNIKTHKNTEPVYLSNYDEEYVVIVDSIIDNKIYHTTLNIEKAKKSKKKATSFISNPNVPYQAALIGISGVSLLGLIVFYTKKKKA